VARTETLSVRIDPQTRKLLSDVAVTRDVPGASALAREILEQWAHETLAARTRASVLGAVSYLRAHPEGWDDTPADFFPGLAKKP
jgi:hypothetical protein